MAGARTAIEPHPYDAGRGRLTGALLVLGAAALWGTMGIFARWAYEHGVGPLEAVSTRASVAFLGLLAVMALRPARLRLPARDLPFFALFGLIGIASFYYLYFAAIERLPVAVAAALLYTAPAFTVLLGRAVLGERVGARKAAALAVVLLGVFLVTGAWPAGAGMQAVTGAGVLLGLGAGLTYACFTLFGKKARRRFDTARTVLYATGFGALALGLLAPPWRAPLEHPEAIPALAGLSILATLLANLLFMGGLGRIEAGVASMLATIEPVVAALLGFALLGEGLAGGQVVGILVVIGAAAALTRGPRPPIPARPVRSPRSPAR